MAHELLIAGQGRLATHGEVDAPAGRRVEQVQRRVPRRERIDGWCGEAIVAPGEEAQEPDARADGAAQCACGWLESGSTS